MSILVTGAAGFIGPNLIVRLIAEGEQVIGVDNLNEYYDITLKYARLARFQGTPHFSFVRADVSDAEAITAVVERHPDIEHIVHLAAQAGVCYSLTNPYTYVDSNVMGQVVMLEASRRLNRLKSFVYASSSSVYGANTTQPFKTTDRADHPVSLYAATKRATELITESYCRLYTMNCIGLRFFTVYGPWGLPDMAYYLFTHAILNGEPINLFSDGDMERDFTYIDDVVAAIVGATGLVPAASASHRIYNIGHNRPERLLTFVTVLEQALGRTAIKQFLPMQLGDVRSAFADIDDAYRDLGYASKTPIQVGLPIFAEWYKEYHRVGKAEMAASKH